MFATERRYVKRIVVPTILGGTLALVIYLTVQDVEINEVDSKLLTDRAQLTKTYTSEVESLQAAIVSLDQSLTSESVAKEDLQAISNQRGKAEQAISNLESASQENWNTRLEYAYEQVNQYSELIGDAIDEEAEG